MSEVHALELVMVASCGVPIEYVVSEELTPTGATSSTSATGVRESPIERERRTSLQQPTVLEVEPNA